MSFWRWLGRRLLGIIPTLFLVSVLVFSMVRLLPGNPAYRLAGIAATPETIARLETEMGLDKPLPVQYVLYLKRVFHGDFGNSTYTRFPVLTELAQRIPATLELLTLSLLAAISIGVPLGAFLAIVQRRLVGRIADRLTFLYGMLAGAIPEFWVGLMLIYLFFFRLRWFPGPTGQLDFSISPPVHITGMYLFDALLTFNWPAFLSAARHLALPVATLAFLTTAPIIKMTRASLNDALNADYVQYARKCGLPTKLVIRYALRSALPPIVTLVALLYSYLLGGAVLVEKVFAWGGLGQYAVQSVVVSDYPSLQAFVLIAAVFSLFVFLIVDIIYALIDPRIRL